ncbi:hypothetical protein Poly21_30090 [Allorhodopirellula heiligendammensis]|uniref:Uncharacterized protein n=1 Tax=Allorhodopirellula heiligendammensis TaxID=2714739 RepID=A0A5C6BVZ1_9BACT|nr:hypothetical protein Poly21_30090 [Allorhodopirellula heiligendammensis]
MRKRFSLRVLLATVAFSAICCGSIIAVRHSIVGRTYYARRLEAQIDGLYAKQPSTLNAEQWKCMVEWTRNLHGNSLIAFQTSTGEIAAFESRISERLSGNVDGTTIEWIWDEYAVICPGGENYQRFRIMLNESLVALKSPVLLEPPTIDQENGR